MIAPGAVENQSEFSSNSKDSFVSALSLFADNQKANNQSIYRRPLVASRVLVQSRRHSCYLVKFRSTLSMVTVRAMCKASTWISIASVTEWSNRLDLVDRSSGNVCINA